MLFAVAGSGHRVWMAWPTAMPKIMPMRMMMVSLERMVPLQDEPPQAQSRADFARREIGLMAEPGARVGGGLASCQSRPSALKPEVRITMPRVRVRTSGFKKGTRII